MNNDLLIYTDHDKDEILKVFGKTTEDVNQDIEAVKNWLQKQPHLPEMPSDVRFERFLLWNKFNVQKTKNSFDMYYTVRSGELFQCFSKVPNDPIMQKIMDDFYFIPSPRLSDDFRRTLIHKFKGTVPDYVEAQWVLAHSCNMIEIFLTDDYCLGWNIIFDLSGITFNYLKTVTPSLMKQMVTLIQKIFPNRVQLIHVVSAPSYVNTVITIFKTFLKPKMRERVIIDAGTDSLLLHHSKQILPRDFGGDERSLAELNEEWKKKLSEMNWWYEQRSKLKVNEALRIEPLDGEFSGLEGNFRKLEID